MKVLVLCLESDRAFVERIAGLLRSDGHEVHVVPRERFPIADPLSALLATASAQHEAVITVLTEDGGREQWVASEIAVHAEMSPNCRFLVIGDVPAKTKRGEQLAVFGRDDTDGLRASLRRVPSEG